MLQMPVHGVPFTYFALHRQRRFQRTDVAAVLLCRMLRQTKLAAMRSGPLRKHGRD